MDLLLICKDTSFVTYCGTFLTVSSVCDWNTRQLFHTDTLLELWDDYWRYGDKPVCVHVCVLAVHGFTSQTQFSNCSVALHYWYRIEPADKVTLRQSILHIKVFSANISSHMFTVMDIHTQTHYTYAHIENALKIWQGRQLRWQTATWAGVTTERGRRLQEVTKASWRGRGRTQPQIHLTYILTSSQT